MMSDADSERQARAPIKKPEWLGEVVIQSLAIVASILLALWADQWKEHRAGRQLEVVSLTSFLKEIRQNEARLDDVQPYHKGILKMLARLDSSRSVQTQAEYQNAVGAEGLRPPSLLQTAWMTAVSTGVLTKLDYETVSALSLTYTLEDRFREDGRAGMQTVTAASSFTPGGAPGATHIAVSYLRDLVASEDELRTTFTEAERVVRKKLEEMDGPAAAAGESSSRLSPERGAPSRRQQP